MKKTLILKSLSLLCLLTVACNKNEDIIIDDPENENPGMVTPDTPADLPYEVIEYIPAPGQYINDSALGFGNVTSENEACRLVEKRLSENLFVSLGSWGGYITVKFDNEIKNSGGYDFAISSNSFDSSNEPGIVWVMSDLNRNGKADDEWYELKGSYYGKEGYERDYWVTYFKPDSEEPTPWTDSNGDSGVINRMGSYHSQAYYYPLWVKSESYTLHGSRLPSQAYLDPITGMWTNLPFEWGYVDNSGEDSQLTSINGKSYQMNYFRISDAIDSEGKPIEISAIDFIKVQTAINGSAGWLGENSTEVCGFFRLD